MCEIKNDINIPSKVRRRYRSVIMPNDDNQSGSTKWTYFQHSTWHSPEYSLIHSKFSKKFRNTMNFHGFRREFFSVIFRVLAFARFDMQMIV